MKPTLSRHILHVLLQLSLLVLPQAWSKKDLHGYFKKHKLMLQEGSRPRGLDPPRRPLPTPLLAGRTKTLKCGSHHRIFNDRYVHFNINSPGKDCFHAFYGSKASECTVAILCENDYSITPSDCSSGYILLRDGTTGIQKGCEKFSMGGTGRYARNGGKDMYVNVKGTAKGTCVAFCKEDLTNAQLKSGTKKPAKLLTNNLPTEVKTDKSCRCGVKRKQAGRIVGGEETMPFEFPWLGGLTVTWEGMTRMPMCGVSLITDRWVLSAAHCMEFDWEDYKISDLSILLHAHVNDLYVMPEDTGKEDSYKKVPGYDRPQETDESEHSVRRNVERIITHPFFIKDTNFDWDVALIKLTQPVSFGKLVTPICLPKLGDFSDYPIKSKHTVAGWGMHSEFAPTSSRIMQKLDVELGKCERWWGGSTRHICAGYLTGGLDACQGDSGGPLMYKFKSDQYVQSGIVSAGTGCAREGRLGLYTNVKEVLQWIYLHIGESPTKVCQI